ncbi:MAG: hypothetical protein JST18_12080 [Bacteroidetes bacterium]|nr:hypothetical protein [Bacteroidota bacterium]
MKSLFHVLFCAPLLLGATTPMFFTTDTPKSLLLETNIYTVQKETPLSEKEAALITHVKESIHNSWVGISQITEGTQREIEGISSSHVNHLLSSLCRFPHTRYLQISLGAGHSFISALHKNHETIDYAVGIDNWLDGKREVFEKNRSQFLLDNQCNYRIYPSNCFSLDPKKYIASPINIYFCAGSFDEASQEKAFTYYNGVFDDLFVAVVDGWNAASTKAGTASAFKKLNYEILFEADLPAHRTLWWNGVYIAVVRKARLQLEN